LISAEAPNDENRRPPELALPEKRTRGQLQFSPKGLVLVVPSKVFRVRREQKTLKERNYYADDNESNS
jgi:hypothetical protein